MVWLNNALIPLAKVLCIVEPFPLACHLRPAVALSFSRTKTMLRHGGMLLYAASSTWVTGFLFRSNVRNDTI